MDSITACVKSSRAISPHVRINGSMSGRYRAEDQNSGSVVLTHHIESVADSLHANLALQFDTSYRIAISDRSVGER